ncbi:TetR/AcrR family transcriptional regulator [Streptomyces johnsoniae]|uniref:TetR/AcrR family transcriptional regulator n=1 Tax=Streptomyces johnsoniae TaxID=3075532 RepID=A0ABU2S4I1_9ACTN|nr:TetR/AcrR family transcriptional regulator [Streptomyces sp. DSM 41886]MDT0443893.1 TetR/AcrR family transcriptional regulator [Streptomyces sp. DSM 41886]
MPEQRPHGSVWFRADERTARPRLSRERIVTAAIELLDAEGVEGFSMRRLAARLHAGTMSLYSYVATKEDVLDLALDAVMDEIELDGEDAPPKHWRADLTGQLVQSRRVMQRHTWITALIGTRPLLGPTSLARSERFYAALERAGLSGPELVAAVSTLFSYVHGYVAAENVWRSRVGSREDELDLRRRAQRHVVAHADRYPALARNAGLDRVGPGPDGGADLGDADLGDPDFGDAAFGDGFARGLDLILDGIEAALGRGTVRGAP